MAYYFMVEEKKGQYRELDLSSVKGFASKKYKKFGAYGLDELDSFTMMFDDELELRRTLYSSGVLSNDNVLKPLAIRWVTSNSRDKVPYEFLYQDSIDYVFDPTKIYDEIMYRYNCNDFAFIRKFADHFRNYRVCSTTASEVSGYAFEAVNYNNDKYLCIRDVNGDNMVSRLVKLLLFKHVFTPNGYIHYSDEVEYRNLHEIIAFIKNYDQQMCLIPQKRKITMEDIMEHSLVIEPKVKTRKKEKREIDGQLTFFDMCDDLS